MSDPENELNEFVVVFCHHQRPGEAEAIARTLVEERLAAFREHMNGSIGRLTLYYWRALQTAWLEI